MSEILVSNLIYTDLARRWQWIDHNPDAMAQMAEALNAPPPDADEPMYLIHEEDINVRTVPTGPYGGVSKKILPMLVYHQGPEKNYEEILPNHRIFVTQVKRIGFDNYDLTRAVAKRLVLPRRRRREMIAGVFGGTLAVGSLGLIYSDLAVEAGAATVIVGLSLVAWGGPKPRLPDLSGARPPLFLADCARPQKELS